MCSDVGLRAVQQAVAADGASRRAREDGGTYPPAPTRPGRGEGPVSRSGCTYSALGKGRSSDAAGTFPGRTLPVFPVGPVDQVVLSLLGWHFER